MAHTTLKAHFLLRMKFTVGTIDGVGGALLIGIGEHPKQIGWWTSQRTQGEVRKYEQGGREV